MELLCRLLNMNSITFLKVYLPAVELALASDNHNDGFFVKGPEHYIEPRYWNEVDEFIESNNDYQEFIDMVGVYFDAKSHYAAEIEGESVEAYKDKLLQRLNTLRREYEV